MDQLLETTSTAGAIVVGADGSPGADRALDWAVDDAHRSGRRLVVIHAAEPLATGAALWSLEGGISVAQLRKESHVAGRALLDRARARALRRHGDVQIDTDLREQDARTALLGTAADAHRLVVGSRGRGPVASLLLGSVGVALVRVAECPVVVVRPGTGTMPGSRVLVGVDTTERCLPTVEAAFAEASLRRGGLTVAHCVWDAEAAILGWSLLTATSPSWAASRLALSESLAGMREKFPDVPVHLVLAHGSVEQCLLDLACANELVVVGRHGSSLLDHLGLGSVGTVVVEQTSATVLVVP